MTKKDTSPNLTKCSHEKCILDYLDDGDYASAITLLYNYQICTMKGFQEIFILAICIKEPVFLRMLVEQTAKMKVGKDGQALTKYFSLEKCFFDLLISGDHWAAETLLPNYQNCTVDGFEKIFNTAVREKQSVFLEILAERIASMKTNKEGMDLMSALLHDPKRHELARTLVKNYVIFDQEPVNNRKITTQAKRVLLDHDFLNHLSRDEKNMVKYNLTNAKICGSFRFWCACAVASIYSLFKPSPKKPALVNPKDTFPQQPKNVLPDTFTLVSDRLNASASKPIDSKSVAAAVSEKHDEDKATHTESQKIPSFWSPRVKWQDVIGVDVSFSRGL